MASPEETVWDEGDMVNSQSTSPTHTVAVSVTLLASSVTVTVSVFGAPVSLLPDA